MNIKYMRNNKRYNSLMDVKSAFVNSGYVDWHYTTQMSETPQDHELDGDVAVQTAPPQLKRPPMYAVILLNDDYTPMEFVVEVIVEFFGKTREAATQIMLAIHAKGRGICGLYARDIAETKAKEATDLGKEAGFPLMFTTEPEE